MTFSCVWLKAQQQTGKHSFGVIAHVETILKLTQILRHVLARYVDMSASDTVLQTTPIAFDCVGMGIASRPLFASVVYPFVLVADPIQPLIGVCLIGANASTVLYVFLDDRHNGCDTGVRDNAGHYIPATLNHAEDSRFLVAVFADTLGLTTNVSFVNFNVTGQTIVTIGSGHVLTDFMTYAPCSLVGNAQLPLKLLSRDTMTGRSEQVHRVEPLLERCTRTLKRCASHWMNVVATPCTLISLYLFDSGKLAVLFALRAIQFKAETNTHQMIQTGIVVCKSFE